MEVGNCLVTLDLSGISREILKTYILILFLYFNVINLGSIKSIQKDSFKRELSLETSFDIIFLET